MLTLQTGAKHDAAAHERAQIYFVLRLHMREILTSGLRTALNNRKAAAGLCTCFVRSFVASSRAASVEPKVRALLASRLERTKASPSTARNLRLRLA